MRLTFIIVLLLVSFRLSFSQFELIDIGAKPISLGGAFTSLANNSNAVYYNPAGISQLPFREVSIFYSPAPFGLKELANGSVNYVEPTKYGAFGLSAKTYGFELYKEITATLTYANNYKSKIFYGANVNYYSLKIQNYGSASTFGIDIGVLAYITDFLRWGFSAYNLNRPSIGTQKDKLPQVYRTGISVQPRNDLNFVLDVEKDTRYTASVKAGVEYTLYNMIDLRAGIGTEPTRFSGGVGIYYSLFEIGYGFYNHQDLGLTHQGTITINFGGEKGRKIIRESLKNAFAKRKK
ncbi:MAG: conjugal transfer protein TraF [Ignavibacteria bacterium]|nr:conjugal transfer protein TraF [Ignavibacteria bacterium]